MGVPPTSLLRTSSTPVNKDDGADRVEGREYRRVQAECRLSSEMGRSLRLQGDSNTTGVLRLKAENRHLRSKLGREEVPPTEDQVPEEVAHKVVRLRKRLDLNLRDFREWQLSEQ